MEEDIQAQDENTEDQYILFVNQVGGHHTILKPIKKNYIVKPVQEKEVKFYEQMQMNKDQNKLLKYLPQFYGTTEITSSAKIILSETINQGNFFFLRLIGEKKIIECSEKQGWISKLMSQKNFLGRYLKLQNLTEKFKYPCILDIKMGFTTTSQKHKDRYEQTTSHSHGFRLCGMSIYQNKIKKAIFKDKYWGRQINDIYLERSIAFFFFDGQDIRYDIVNILIRQLQELKETLELYKGFLFDSSSLLIIYEGSVEESCSPSKTQTINNDQSEQQQNQNNQIFQQTPSQQQLQFDNNEQDNQVVLKIIDFANIQIEKNLKRPDNELINGISNLLDILKKILYFQGKELQLQEDII